MDVDEADDSSLSPSYSTVIEWLNNASLATDHEKVDYLRKVSEIVINKEPELLKEFLDNILAFQSDRSVEVRKLIVTFIESIGKKHHQYLPKVLPSLLMLLSDPNLQIQKKVIQTSSTLYKEVILCLAKSDVNADENALVDVWNTANSLKTSIINLVDNDHEGILNQTVKFMQTVIILQTSRDTEDKQNDNISIFDVPLTMKFTKRRKLEEEAMVVFDLLVKFHDSKHISSTSLMTCMAVLTTIALARSQFLGKVIAALETVHTHLPPDLSESQVNAVRKHLKCQLLLLLKHPSCITYQQNIMTLLTDLGATHSEVMKTLPKDDDRKRKYKKPPESAQVAKKLRSEEPPVPVTGLDLTEIWVNERLLPTVATQIIMDTLPNLPGKMPPLFSSAYTPIAAAGTPAQVKHVSRLLATQLHAAGLGPGLSQAPPVKTIEAIDDAESDSEEPKPKPAVPPPVLKPILKNPRTLKLTEITKPLEEEDREKLAVDAVKRILDSEKDAVNGGALRARMKIITSIATTFGLKVREAILEYILGDLRQKLGLAMAWLYEEYSILQGFYKLPEILQHNQKPDHNYNTLLCSLALTVVKRYEFKDRDALFARIYLEAPLITDNALDILKEMSTREVSTIQLLQQLVLKRPAKQLLFLNILLEQTSSHVTEVHKCAIKLIIELYSRTELRNIIEEYATFYLGFLRLPQPPDVLFGLDKGAPMPSEKWTENVTKCCLRLYLSLLPHNEELIHELANVYASTDSDIKRIILRLIEIPVQKMGMSSPQLLKLVDEFPKGAETLVTRVLHIVTDRTPPSEELVNRVKELYQSRVSDVRFLIPVLSGLSKNEIFNALPHLIKLNPNVVKEVFNRLLGSSNENCNAPVTPSELLLALHKIDTTTCELKFVIKATSICFADKSNFTQEVLAVVIQNLMDISPLPTLLMRTVIQAISFYPRLIGFGMNILQRLILKQVWKHKKVWEGFIKCCERTKPNSFQVLLQLPPEQLRDVFQESPGLKPALLDHVLSYTENQRSHIPQDIMDVLYGTKHPLYTEFSVKNEPMSPPELTIDIKEEPQEEAISA